MILPRAMAWLMATAMAMRPFWSEYRILACEPTTCRGRGKRRLSQERDHVKHWRYKREIRVTLLSRRQRMAPREALGVPWERDHCRGCGSLGRISSSSVSTCPQAHRDPPPNAPPRAHAWSSFRHLTGGNSCRWPPLLFGNFKCCRNFQISWIQTEWGKKW